MDRGCRRSAASRTIQVRTRRPAPIVTPRICGICGGSHLYKSAYALDTAWRTTMPDNATLVRNIAQGCETLQSIPRYYYALFAIDFTNKNYAGSTMYDEAVRRYALLRGRHQLPERCGVVPEAGRGLRHLRRSVAALQFHGAGRRDGGADAVGRHPFDRDSGELEGQLAGVRPARRQRRPLVGEQDLVGRAGLDGRERIPRHNSDIGFLIRHSSTSGWTSTARGRELHLHRHVLRSVRSTSNPTIDGRNKALIGRGGYSPTANGSSSIKPTCGRT